MKVEIGRSLAKVPALFTDTFHFAPVHVLLIDRRPYAAWRSIDGSKIELEQLRDHDGKDKAHD